MIMTYRLLIIICLLFPVIGHAAPEASRTSGLAPLAVFFDAGVAASTESSAPFHDLDYTWDFGDPDSGTWGPSGKSKNTDKGPLAAHVYETAGTYTASLTVRDSNGMVGSPTEFTITVTDFSAANTTCISTGTDFTGCPAGATTRPNITTTLETELAAATDANERVLLKRGDSWTLSSTPSFPNNYGPVHIGAFGTCSSPDELGICSNNPSITSSAGFLGTDYKRDWRVTDLTYSGAGTVVGGGIDSRNILGARLNVSGGGTAVSGSVPVRDNDDHWREGLFSISCRTMNVSVMTWIGSEKLVMMGNIHGSTGTTSSHIIRIWNSYKGVFSHNLVYGALSGLHALKFHGPSRRPRSNNYLNLGDFATTGASGVRNPTQFNVVSNNTFGGGSAYLATFGPQDTVSDEEVTDLIIEKNKFITEYGQQSAGNVLLYLTARYVSVRNNVFDGTGNLSEFVGINLANGGLVFDDEDLPEPNDGQLVGVKIYNNTFYHGNSYGSENYGMRLWMNSALRTTVRNNYVSFPNITGTAVVIDPTRAGVDTIQSNNVYTNTPYFVDPDNTNPILRNFAITSSATSSIGQGYTVPVLDDFNGDYRSAPYDLGAYMYGDPTCDTTPSICTTSGDCTSAGWYWDGTECLTSEPETPTCSDGILNGDETGVDCGGSCPVCEAPPSGIGMKISTGASMQVGVGSTPITPIQ